jgi:hypothetical protein
VQWLGISHESMQSRHPAEKGGQRIVSKKIHLRSGRKAASRPWEQAKLILPDPLPDVGHFFPLRVSLWSEASRPTYLTYWDESEPEPTSEAPSETTIRRTHNANRTIERRKIGPLDLQFIPNDKRYRSTLVGRQGCINQLVVALERYRGDNCSVLDIAVEIAQETENSETDKYERALHRINAGSRVGAALVVRLARAYGLDPNDLAFVHTAYKSKRQSARSKLGPIETLQVERRDEELEALANFTLCSQPLATMDSCNQLTKDLVSKVVLDIAEPWRNSGNTNTDVIKCVASRFVALLLEVQDGDALPSSVKTNLSTCLHAIAGELRSHGVTVSFARYIGVREADSACVDDRLNMEERRVVVVLEPTARPTGIIVDLRTDQKNRPSAREKALSEGDTAAAVRSIERDIDWCGHWEGRWLPFWPLSAPDWFRKFIAAPERTPTG